MTAALLCLGLTALALGTGWGLLHAGLRAGDQVGDTTATAVEPDGSGQGVWVTLHNPGRRAVLLGASVRRRSLRLRWEAGYFVSLPRRTAREKLLAGQQAVVFAIGAGETQTMFVPLAAPTPQRAELVLAIGEAHRLRVVHRAVELPRSRRDVAQQTSLCQHPGDSNRRRTGMTRSGPAYR